MCNRFGDSSRHESPSAKVFNNFKLLVNQLNREFHVKEPIFQKYAIKIGVIKERFKKMEFIYIPREKNLKADLLSKLSNIEENVGMENVVHQTIHTLRFAMMIESQESWITSILEYVQNGIGPKDQKERWQLQKKSRQILYIDDKLYRRVFTQPLLKCLRAVEVEYVMVEIHEGCCGQHFEHMNSARKILKADYYWPTIKISTSNYVRRCERCKKCVDIPCTLVNELHSLASL